jgi:hypothetical protein
MTDRRERNRRVSSWVTGGVFLAFGLAVLLFGSSSRHWGEQSKTWPSVSGKISSVKELESGGNPRRRDLYWSVDYAYVVGQAALSGTRVCYGANNEFEVGKGEYTLGQSISVYYDPKRPSRGILRPGYLGQSRDRRWWGFGLIVFGVLTLLPAKSKRRT